jgi:hypothetical protein
MFGGQCRRADIREIEKQFQMLFLMFQSTATSKPSKDHVEVGDLFDDNYFEHISFLDFKKPAPVIDGTGSSMVWILYLTSEIKRLRESLDRTIDKYGVYLELDTINTMENIRTSQFHSMVSNNVTPYYTDIAMGFNLPMTLLMGKPFLDQFREYTELFTKLVREYNQQVDENKKITFTSFIL